jgi:pentatricopeptide repeat protein
LSLLYSSSLLSSFSVVVQPQEGDPDFLLYEMVMDACAQAKRADLLFEVLWPEVCRLRMVVTDTMTFLLFKGACLSVEPRGSPNFVHLARAEAIFKHHANTTSTASGVKQYAGNGGSDMPLEHQGGITRSWYVALISACLEANETAKAFEYFNALKRAGYEADPAMYSHMAAKLVASGSAEQLHHLWRTLVRSPNFSVPKWLYTQLIVSFARLGMIQDMEECRERMGRRLDRFQRHPEPLARSGMLEAYLAAGMVENARDVLAELTAGTTGNGVNDVVQLSVGLQSKLAHSVQAKLREAQVALEKSAKPVEGVEGASSAVKLITRGGRTGATGGGYIAKGVADSCIEGLVAAYSRPQVIPPFAHTPAASLVPSIDKVKPSNILPGLLSIPAPGIKHDTLQALVDLPQRAERLSVSRIFESGAELVARCTGLVERAMALQEQLTQNYEAEEDIREAASYLGALHSRAVPPKSDGRSQGEIFDPSNPDGAPDNDFDDEMSDLEGGGGADEDDRNVDMSEATKPPHTQSVAFHGKFEGENVRAAAFTSVLRGRAEWQAFLEKEGIAILSQAELEEADKEEKKKDDSSSKSKSGRR